MTDGGVGVGFKVPFGGVNDALYAFIEGAQAIGKGFVIDRHTVLPDFESHPFKRISPDINRGERLIDGKIYAGIIQIGGGIGEGL